MKEIWKSIYENYEVSNFGNLRSIDRQIIHPKSGPQLIKGKTMRPNVGKNNGYYYASLRIGGKTYKKYIHDLVCLAFYRDKPDKSHVDHIDKNRLNNSIENLRYTTILENCRMPGSKHPRSVLTESQVIEIRKRYNYTRGHAKILAKEYGVHDSEIGHIIKRRIWNHI